MKSDQPVGPKRPNAAPWKKYRRAAALLLAIAAPAAFAAFMWMPPSMPDLSESDISERQYLYDSWSNGDSIVVVRHLERCDRADVPCLVEKDGLTARSVLVAADLSDDFFRLGLEQADIYNSPLARTDQTADLLFSSRSTDQGWLYNCRQEDTFLRDALSNKKPGRNLVLVTHSSCIARFEDDLGFSSDTPEYGTAIFLAADARSKDIRLLGFVETDDWDEVIHSR